MSSQCKLIHLHRIFFSCPLKLHKNLLTIFLLPASIIDKRTSRLHSALATTLRLVPKAHTELFPILSRNIPFRRKEITIQEWYANQCLAILQYQPDLHEEILGLLIEHCLEIDVEIKVDIGGKVSLDEKKDEEMFDFDADEEEVKKNIEKESKIQEKVEVDEMAERVCFSSYIPMLFHLAISA